MKKKVAVVGLPGGWSSQKLAEAFKSRLGSCPLVDLGQVCLDLEKEKAFFQDLELGSMDGLVIKKVGPAYSPKLLDRLEVLRFVEDRGVRIFSSAHKISAVLSRLSCTLGLIRAGVPMPPTVITESPAEAARAVNEFGRAVLKPLFTSKARGMVVLEAGPAILEDIENYKAAQNGNDTIYIQKMINLPGRDLGVVFLGGRYLATYARVKQSGAWNTTTASGGKYEAYDPPDELIELARRAQDGFGLDFTCVDVAETDDGPVVFEVSAFGGFRGLLEGCGLDAAATYADYVIKELGG